MTDRLNVVSWQASGVAWVPWRVQSLLTGHLGIDYRAYAGYPGMESYDLPELPVVGDVVSLAKGADVVHLHHAYAADELIPEIRSAAPRAKIIVTLHGEPDRSRRIVCRNQPDAYHVVEPGLESLCWGSVPVAFVPNHPSVEFGDPIRWPREKKLLVPFSHVPGFKDRDRLSGIETSLERSGWLIERVHRRISNQEMRSKIARSAAVWVQNQGYFDLLTMECWALGALPIVGMPTPKMMDLWADRLGFRPLPSPELSSWDGVATLEENRAGMATRWTKSRAASQWGELLYSVAGRPCEEPLTC